VPRPQWTCTVSDAPRLARADYEALPPCVQTRASKIWSVRGVWEGSGFLVRDLPGAGWYHEEGARRCGACKSSDTRCIYLDADPGQTWILIKIELVCRKCGQFTLWDGED
jgi:hypothetical protein